MHLPSGLFPSSSQSSRGSDWKDFRYQSSRHVAELFCILYALGLIENRWLQFNDHIRSLLIEDFMEPDAYVKMLFDDHKFSSSRLYFWIIGCLNEFLISIEDNHEDRDKEWKELRQKFDDFPSNQKRTIPSEWWVIRYQISRWLRLGRAKAVEDDGTA